MMNAQVDIRTVSSRTVAPDGYPLTATVYQSTAPGAVLIIAPAVAAPQTLYRHFATFMAGQGIDCITFDYRGTGESLAGNSPYRIQLEDWGRQDIEAIIRLARASYADQTPIHLLGHSIGGQLLGLARSSQALSRIVHIAVSAPYWRRWPRPMSLKMLLLGKAIIPLLSAFRAQFPSHLLGLGTMKVPSSAVRQWARWMSRPDYLFDPAIKLDLSGYQQLNQPLLALGFSDDELAPPVNIDALLDHFPNALITREQIDVTGLGAGPVGHSGFFKSRFRDNLWQSVSDWLKGQTTAA